MGKKYKKNFDFLAYLNNLTESRRILIKEYKTPTESVTPLLILYGNLKFYVVL